MARVETLPSRFCREGTIKSTQPLLTTVHLYLVTVVCSNASHRHDNKMERGNRAFVLVLTYSNRESKKQPPRHRHRLFRPIASCRLPRQTLNTKRRPHPSCSRQIALKLSSYSSLSQRAPQPPYTAFPSPTLLESSFSSSPPRSSMRAATRFVSSPELIASEMDPRHVTRLRRLASKMLADEY